MIFAGLFGGHHIPHKGSQKWVLFVLCSLEPPVIFFTLLFLHVQLKRFLKEICFIQVGIFQWSSFCRRWSGAFSSSARRWFLIAMPPGGMTAVTGLCLCVHGVCEVTGEVMQLHNDVRKLQSPWQNPCGCVVRFYKFYNFGDREMFFRLRPSYSLLFTLLTRMFSKLSLLQTFLHRWLFSASVLNCSHSLLFLPEFTHK